MSMKQYNVTGMSCAACQARVEKAVSAVDGVESCAVSLLTNSMGVEGDADPDKIVKAVEAAGYGAALKSTETKSKVDYNNILDDSSIKMIRARLVCSFVFLLPLIYVSMGYGMLGFPVPDFLKGNSVSIGIYELLLSGIIMVINQRFFINGYKGLMNRAPNMDSLVALGAMASFGYSVYALFAACNHAWSGNTMQAMEYVHEYYFESAGMILTLITVGKLLEAISKGKTTDALKSLIKLSPQTAVVKRDGREITVEIDAVRLGDLFIVKPGDMIPVDGVIREGFGAIDESTFTGESLPVDKKTGDMVSAATVNTNGYLECEATRIGEDTSLSKIIRLVSDAAATKAPIAKIADKVSGIFVPVVISIAALTFVIWFITSGNMGYSLARAISVLVISCPCALGLATPVAIMVGNGVAAKTGILFKTAVALEQMGKTQIIALDKTGTITTGKMQVTDIVPASGVTKDVLLKYAVSLEMKSEHPISKAITEHKVEDSLYEVSDFVAVAGNGLQGIILDEKTYGGNYEYIKSMTAADVSELKSVSEDLAAQGKTPVFFASESKLYGMIAVADMIKEDSAEAIRQLKNLGLHVVMITGDNKKTANAIARIAEVNEVVASVKPDEKEQVIRQLEEYGRVAMVGDGINDAPALTRASIGVAIGAGTDIAIEAADVVLAKSSLMDVAAAIRISRAAINNIKQNLFWAFIYNIVGIPLAAGCYVSMLGWSLSPMFGAAAMSLSSFCVISNSLRLNLIKAYTSKNDKKLKNTIDGHLLETNVLDNKEEKKTMEISVKGMMCPHCEAHVKSALERIEGVEEAIANHAENKVTIKTAGAISEDSIKTAVAEAGYEYCGVI